MIASNIAFHVTSPDPKVTERELAQLALLRERFPSHHIFHLVMGDRGVRFIAQRAAEGVHPHTVMTGDLAELGDELARASGEEVQAVACRD
jgi:hypothetical protein